MATRATAMRGISSRPTDYTSVMVTSMLPRVALE
jgi:hypothetical protein